MGIPIGMGLGSAEGISSVKAGSCEKCQTEFLYRIESSRVSASRKRGAQLEVACPECGWLPHQGTEQVSRTPRAVRIFLGTLGVCTAIAVMDKLVMTGLLLKYWPGLLGLSSLGGVGAYLSSPANLDRADIDPKTLALASRAVALYDLEPGVGPTDEALERELYRCLRAAMLSMAGIDGDLDPSEMVAISQVYTKITGEKIDIATLERQAEACMGQHEKMLNTLDCIGPYLNAEGRGMFLKAVLVIASADGKIDPAEVDLTKSIGEALGMEPSEIRAVVKALKASRSRAL